MLVGKEEKTRFFSKSFLLSILRSCYPVQKLNIKIDLRHIYNNKQ